MKVHVSHSREKQDAKRILDQPLSVLFAEAVNGLEIVNERRVWKQSTMTFSFLGRVGFISLPVRGWMEIQEAHVIVDIEVPAAARMLIGEEKIRAGLEKEIRALMKRP